jgi:hypothetical protein
MFNYSFFARVQLVISSLKSVFQHTQSNPRRIGFLAMTGSLQQPIFRRGVKTCPDGIRRSIGTSICLNHAGISGTKKGEVEFNFALLLP